MKLIKEIKISDNGFVFNSNTGDSFRLNYVGLEMLRLISQDKEFEEIKNEFTGRYDTDELTFEKDFYEFCSLLKLYQIIVSDNSTDFN